MMAGGLIKARFHFNSLRAIDFDRFFHCLNCIQFKHVAHTCTRHASFNVMSSGLLGVCMPALLLKRQKDCFGKAFDMPLDLPLEKRTSSQSLRNSLGYSSWNFSVKLNSISKQSFFYLTLTSLKFQTLLFPDALPFKRSMPLD